MNGFLNESSRVHAQNRAQNRDFSENPRWGPYKNHKNTTKNRHIRGNSRKTAILSSGTVSVSSTRQFDAGTEKSLFLTRKSSGSVRIVKNEHLFERITPCCCSKPCPKPWFFGKSSMGTLEKSQNVHEKSMSTRYFAKNMDFKVLNGFDHIYEAIRSSSWKIVIFEPKMFRAAHHHQKWTCFLLNRFLKLFKTVFKTTTFQKILDGDPRKIAKC